MDKSLLCELINLYVCALHGFFFPNDAELHLHTRTLKLPSLITEGGWRVVDLD